MSRAPAISVLLPARNAEATLATCLRSLLRQSEPDWECIVVEDASDDATAAVARQFAARDPRFRVVEGPGRGIVAALEAGRRACRGPLVARMDADDWMLRDRLRAQRAALEREPGLAGVGCHVRLFPRSGLRDGRRRYERWLGSIATADDVERDALVECPIAHPTWMLRREVLDRHGYCDRGVPEDYDLLLRMLADGERLGVVPRRLLAWRDGPARLSRTHPAYSEEAFTRCKAGHLARGLLADTRSYVLWGYGGTGRALRRALLDHDRHPSHIVELHPRRIGQTIHGARVVAPEALAELAELAGRPIVASVSGPGPRQQIRVALATLGLREGRDFVCAA